MEFNHAYNLLTGLMQTRFSQKKYLLQLKDPNEAKVSANVLRTFGITFH